MCVDEEMKEKEEWRGERRMEVLYALSPIVRDATQAYKVVGSAPGKRDKDGLKVEKIYHVTHA